MKLILWLAELLISYLKEQNGIKDRELEEAVKRNKEHDEELERLNAYKESVLENIEVVKNATKMYEDMADDVFKALEESKKRYKTLAETAIQEIGAKSDEEILKEEL